jgi:hypothetical protein
VRSYKRRSPVIQIIACFCLGLASIPIRLLPASPTWCHHGSAAPPWSMPPAGYCLKYKLRSGVHPYLFNPLARNILVSDSSGWATMPLATSAGSGKDTTVDDVVLRLDRLVELVCAVTSDLRDVKALQTVLGCGGEHGQFA